MAAASEIIKAALRRIRVLESGETPAAEETADALEILNDMIAGWQTEDLLIYANTLESFTLTSGQSTYTIGSGADFDTTRPTRILQAFTRISNIDYPIEIVSRDAYFSIVAKESTSTYPYFLYYDDQLTTGKIYLYPVPNSAETLWIDSQKPFTSFADSIATAQFPSEYVKLMKYGLAAELAPEYGVQLDPVSIGIYERLKKGVKRNNKPRVRARIETKGSRYNIYSDT